MSKFQKRRVMIEKYVNRMKESREKRGSDIATGRNGEK